MVDINEWTRVGSPVADKKVVPIVVGSHQQPMNDILINILSPLLCISVGGGGLAPSPEARNTMYTKNVSL